MTYTFKLSCRLALMWASACAVVLVAAACTDGDMSSMSPFDQLGNGGTASVSASVLSPKAAVVETNKALKFNSSPDVSWSSTGGKMSSDGTFSSSVTGSFLVVGRGKTKTDSARVTVVNPNQPRILTISPREVQLTVGQTLQFSDSVRLPNGTPTTVDVTWASDGGSVDKFGNFIAGAVPGTFSVIVSAPTAGAADTAVVTVTPVVRHIVQMVLAPAAAVVVADSSVQYTATAKYDDGSVGPAMVSFGVSGGGSIDSKGRFTAGSTPGTFEVSATAQDGSAKTSTAVSVAAGTTAGSTSSITLSNPSAAYPNEPTGFSPIVEMDFSKLPGTTGAAAVGQASHLFWGGDTNMTLVNDATAPQSGASVLQTRMPQGLQAGYPPGHFAFWNSLTAPQDYRRIYVSFWIRIPGSDYENQAVYTKLFYFAHGNDYQKNEDVIALEGKGTNGLMSAMALNFSHSQADDRSLDVNGTTSLGSGVTRTENVNTATKLTVGTWHHVELFADVGTVQPFQRQPSGSWIWNATGGNYDGTVRMWLDGTKVMEYSPANGNGLKFLDSDYSFTRGFFASEWTPVWGGVGGCGSTTCYRTRTDYIDMDHLYISGQI